jgi:hypothetical protein
MVVIIILLGLGFYGTSDPNNLTSMLFADNHSSESTTLSTISSIPISLENIGAGGSAAADGVSRSATEGSMSATADILWDVINPSRADRYVEIRSPIYVTVVKPGDAVPGKSADATAENNETERGKGSTGNGSNAGAKKDKEGVWRISVDSYEFELSPSMFTVLVVLVLLGFTLLCVFITSVMYLHSKSTKKANRLSHGNKPHMNGYVRSRASSSGDFGVDQLHMESVLSRRRMRSHSHKWFNENFRVMSLSSTSSSVAAALSDLEFMTGSGDGTLCWSSSGFGLSGSKGGSLHFWNSLTARKGILQSYPLSKQLRKLGVGVSGKLKVSCMVFVDGLPVVVVGTKDGLIRMWRTDTGDMMGELLLLSHSYPAGIVDIKYVGMSFDGCVSHEFVVACVDGSLRSVFASENASIVDHNKNKKSLQGPRLPWKLCDEVLLSSEPSAEPSSTSDVRRTIVVVAEASGLVFCGCLDGRIEICKTLSGVEDEAQNTKAPSPPLITLHGHSGSVTSLKYTAALDILISGSDTGELILWHVSTGRELFYIGGAEQQSESARRNSHSGSFGAPTALHGTNSFNNMTSDGFGKSTQNTSGSSLRSRRPSTTNMAGGFNVPPTFSHSLSAGSKFSRGVPILTGHSAAITFVGVYHADSASTPSTPTGGIGRNSIMSKTHKILIASSGKDECTKIWEVKLLEHLNMGLGSATRLAAVTPSFTSLASSALTLSVLKLVKSINQPGCTIAAMHGSLLVGARKSGSISASIYGPYDSYGSNNSVGPTSLSSPMSSLFDSTSEAIGSSIGGILRRRGSFRSPSVSSSSWNQQQQQQLHGFTTTTSIPSLSPRSSEDSSYGYAGDTWRTEMSSQYGASNRPYSFDDNGRPSETDDDKVSGGWWELWMADLSDPLEPSEIVKTIPIGEDRLKGSFSRLSKGLIGSNYATGGSATGLGVYASATIPSMVDSKPGWGTKGINLQQVQSSYPYAFQRTRQQGSHASEAAKQAIVMTDPNVKTDGSRRASEDRFEGGRREPESTSLTDAAGGRRLSRAAVFDTWDDDDDDIEDEEGEGHVETDYDDGGYKDRGNRGKETKRDNSGEKGMWTLDDVGTPSAMVDPREAKKVDALGNLKAALDVDSNEDLQCDEDFSEEENEEDDDDEDEEVADSDEHEDENEPLPVFEIRLIDVLPWGICVGFGSQVKVIAFDTHCFVDQSQQPQTMVMPSSPMDSARTLIGAVGTATPALSGNNYLTVPHSSGSALTSSSFGNGTTSQKPHQISSSPLPSPLLSASVFSTDTPISSSSSSLSTSPNINSHGGGGSGGSAFTSYFQLKRSSDGGDVGGGVHHHHYPSNIHHPYHHHHHTS